MVRQLAPKHFLSSLLVGCCTLAGCGGPTLTCREPDISSFTGEGVPDALCDVTFSACEDNDYLTVSCNNDTFEGDYECTWLWLRGTHTSSGSFQSADFCTLDAAAMVEELNDEGGLRITVE